jgi:hypothetical protein
LKDAIRNRENRRSQVRVLFGSFGWPCGLWDLASYSQRFADANVRIVPLHSDSVLQCEPGDYRGILQALELRETHGKTSGWEDESLGLILDALGADFARELIAQRSHVVGFRLEAGRLEDVQRSIQAVRLLSDAELVIGGPSVTSHPIESYEESGADYAFLGEAEESFTLFLEYATTKHDSKDFQPDVPGLVYRWAGQVVANQIPTDGYERKPWRPATSVEVMARNSIDPTVLGAGWDREEIDSLFLVGGRGCPGQCAFCAKTHGTRVRVKHADQLMEEAQTLDKLVERNVLRVSRWPLFAETDRADLHDLQVAWLAVFDEDFFLDRRRALDFFSRWEQTPLRDQYRLNFQTNPCSLLLPSGMLDDELFGWIDRLKPMIQLGVESFHPELLSRWRKRHDLVQLETVLQALEATRQDYTAFQLLTDYETTPSELLDNLWLLTLASKRFPRMRIAVNPYTIPLGGSDTKSLLDFVSDAEEDVDARPFSEYEVSHPEWMDPTTAALADLADERLQAALHSETRQSAFLELWDAIAAYCSETGSVGEELAEKVDWFKTSLYS